MTDCYVYAKCVSGRRHYLEKSFTGTRKECKDYVQDRVRNGRPTQFLEVSSLDIVTATKKLCDGAIWDPVNVCYYD